MERGAKSAKVKAEARPAGAGMSRMSGDATGPSLELRTPLNAIIGFSEVLSERMFGATFAFTLPLTAMGQRREAA